MAISTNGAARSPGAILCEVYAKLAAMLIQHWLIQLGCWQEPHRSLVKAAQVVRREAGRLMVGLYEEDWKRSWSGSCAACSRAVA